MEKVDLTKQFALRLRDAMLAASLSSSRSTSGVCIHRLAEITGYSVQICRRYLRGEAIPEPAKLMEIAEQLQVSPGWLLFGEDQAQNPSSADCIVISRNLLRYIFSHAAVLYQKSPEGDDVSHFLLALIDDISKINTDSEEQAKKIIDLALSSIRHFNH